MALAIGEILASGSVNGHSAPPICGTPLTVVEGEKLRLIIYLRHVINYFVKLFSLIDGLHSRDKTAMLVQKTITNYGRFAL